MSDTINLSQNVGNVEIAPEFDGYSRVVLYTGEQDENGNDKKFEAGNTSGRTLYATSAWATQAQANALLARIKGWQYQPFEARDAILDPAAELGDGIAANGVYSGLYVRATTFDALMASDISAPHDEELDHEYQYSTPEKREFKRIKSNIRSEFKIQAEQISAKVSARDGTSTDSCSWTLTKDSWEVRSKGKTVFTVDSNGATVKGVITATSGYIGSESNGFTITASAIHNNMPDGMKSTQTRGVYIGKDGIKLGQKFQVDSSGNLIASSGTFTGNVYANRISTGGNAGYITGSQIGSSTVAYGNVTFPDKLYQVDRNSAEIAKINGYFTGSASFGSLSASNLYIGGARIFPSTIYVDGRNYAVVGYQYV